MLALTIAVSYFEETLDPKDREKVDHLAEIYLTKRIISYYTYTSLMNYLDTLQEEDDE